MQFDDSYSFIEGISDSDESENDDEVATDEGPLTFTPEEVYEKVMAKIHDCTDDDLDCDFSESEDLFSDTSVIKGTLKDIKEGFEKTVEIVEEKWEILSEGNWKEFSDQTAVFKYIHEKVRESIDS